MAINKNHEFEELDGVKCGIVEKNVPPKRVEFLKKILEYNKFTVVVAPSPPPKTTPASKTVEGEEAPVVAEHELPETFNVGVTDYTFNTINAIFGRLLNTPKGNVVTLAYWNQLDTISNDELPYYENNKNY